MTDAPFTETHRATLLWMGGILAHRGQRDASNAAIKEIERLTLLVQACGKTECVPLAALDAAEVQRYAAIKEIDRLRQLQDEAITRLKAQRDRAAEKGDWNDVNATDETLAMLKGLRDDPR